MKRGRTDSTIHAAAFGAAALIASQVAGKATRDAFFLSQFPVTALPAMVIVASLLSVAAGFVTPRLLNSRSNRQLSWAFVGSAVLLFAEWRISTWNPAMAAILIYLHMTILGSVLISGFWSLLDDRHDARSARKQFGKIVAASTLGGIIGGVLAGRVGSSAGIASMLPVLAFLHIICAFMASSMATGQKETSKLPATRPRETGSGLTVLRTVPYVRNVALVILTSTMGAGLLDYVFKARVSAAYLDGEELVEFFALFYTAIGVATFLVQLILSRVAVEKLGIAGTVSSLPASLAIGSIGALVLPGVPAASAMRGSEAMVRSSLFKSGYEMLYAAVPRRERQATKAILDIGVDRMGDLLGALLLGGISWALSPNSTTIMLISAAFLGIVGFTISRRLRLGYVQALENSLVSRSMSAVHLPNLPAIGASIIMTLRNFAAGQDSQPKPVVEKPVTRDPLIQRIQDLRSSNPEIIRNRLRQPLEPVLAYAVIELLAWDEVSADAIGALIMMGPRISGQLVDALVDPDQEFAIRRRIPRVLGTFDSQRAVDGLIEGLFDSRFEVRYHSGHALAQIKSRNPMTEIRQKSIISAVERELEVSPDVWRNYRVIDSARQEPTETITIDHIFRLLALVHASEPMQLAHRALKSRDEHLRRTSLEYLENVLPHPVWQRILPLFEEGATIAIG